MFSYMIKVKHPKEEINKNQEQFLSSCPLDQRRYHELLFTFGNITYRYHLEAERKKPNVEDYNEWLEGLPENMRKEMESKGFEWCKNVLSFTRYVMEKNDIGLEKYIKLHMATDDYEEYKKMI